MQAVTKHDKLFTYQVRIQIQGGLDAGLVAQTQAKTNIGKIWRIFQKMLEAPQSLGFT